MFFAGVCGASRVVAFELNPKAMSLLRRNISLNRLGSVDLSFLGVGCARDRGTVAPAITDERVHHNLGAMSFARSDDLDGRPVDAIDNMLPHDRVDLIKIDVEGMEADVLAGASKIIERCSPLLYIEVWGDIAIFDCLHMQGYEVVRIHGPNILCRRKANGQDVGTPDDAPIADKLLACARGGAPALAAFFALNAANFETFDAILRERAAESICPALHSKLMTMRWQAAGSPFVEWGVDSVANSEFLDDGLYRNELIRKLLDNGDRRRASAVALAGLDRSPDDAYCLHVKSMTFEEGGLLHEALRCAEMAYERSISERMALAIRVADLLRNTGGDLDRALSLTSGTPAASPLHAWSEAVKASILTTQKDRP
ncbi:MAG: FkbM family methyltransferase [Hyphomicrobiales bacterium]|nr:FkbM family methyltransferase [Hyphomicrobiales bacterium]